MTLVEETDGEETWRAEGTDSDRRPIVAIVVAYEDEKAPAVKVVTAWKRT